MSNKKTYTYEVEMSKGYSGKAAAYNKGWIARITGTDDTYGLERSFCKGKPNSDDPYRKAKCQWMDVYELEIGLYEILEGGERIFARVYESDGQLKCTKTTEERAKRIAELLDDEIDFAEALELTKPQTA